MSEVERTSARRAIEAFNSELALLGERELDHNPSFRRGEPHMGVFPVYRLEKAGAAPLSFVFGETFEVWVGPFSEVLVIPVSATDSAAVGEIVRRVLRSSVNVTPGRMWTKITFAEPHSAPWRTLRVIGKATVPTPSGSFEAFLAPGGTA